MVALAAVPWVAVTGRRVAVVELGAAIVGASLVSIVAARSRRVPPAGEVLLSVAGLAALLLLVVVGDPLGGGEVLRGLRDGVPRVLSTSLPMIDVTWAGVPGATVVWLAAAVVASTVARTRSVAGPVLAVIVTFLAGYAVTLGGRTGDVAATALPEVLFLGLVTGAFALTRSFHGLPDEERGVLALRVTTAVMTLAVALAAGAAAAARGPFVPEEPVRPRLEPVVTELEPEGPLLVTRRLREEEPDRAVATVSVSQDWAGYLPYAVLDRFDGRSWSRADDRLTPTGGVVPVTLPAPPGPEVVVRDLDVAATGGWLPYVGRVASLSGVSVLQAEGEVFRLAEPAASTTYRLRSAQPATTVQDEDLSGDQPTARSSGLVRGLEVAQLATDQRTAGERVCRLARADRGWRGRDGVGRARPARFPVRPPWPRPARLRPRARRGARGRSRRGGQHRRGRIHRRSGVPGRPARARRPTLDRRPVDRSARAVRRGVRARRRRLRPAGPAGDRVPDRGAGGRRAAGAARRGRLDVGRGGRRGRGLGRGRPDAERRGRHGAGSAGASGGHRPARPDPAGGARRARRRGRAARRRSATSTGGPATGTVRGRGARVRSRGDRAAAAGRRRASSHPAPAAGTRRRPSAGRGCVAPPARHRGRAACPGPRVADLAAARRRPRRPGTPRDRGADGPASDRRPRRLLLGARRRRRGRSRVGDGHLDPPGPAWNGAVADARRRPLARPTSIGDDGGATATARWRSAGWPPAWRRARRPAARGADPPGRRTVATPTACAADRSRCGVPAPGRGCGARAGADP
jgi:hypothetical protein